LPNEEFDIEKVRVLYSAFEEAFEKDRNFFKNMPAHLQGGKIMFHLMNITAENKKEREEVCMKETQHLSNIYSVMNSIINMKHPGSDELSLLKTLQYESIYYCQLVQASTKKIQLQSEMMGVLVGLVVKEKGLTGAT
jgi:hypothetical protein